MEYDAIGRLISTTKPADEGKTATSSTSYNGLSTTTTNASTHIWVIHLGLVASDVVFHGGGNATHNGFD
jgi:hypothetical protein